MTATTDLEQLKQQVAEFLKEHDPSTISTDEDRLEWLRARYDAGLAWVHFPAGRGGQGLPRDWQVEVDKLFTAASAPDNNSRTNGIGLGMAAPTILGYGTPEQLDRFLKPLWVGEEIWCQLFSEPGAGSDLAAVGTRAVRDGDEWVVNGQKVWTSGAHNADWAILVARTDPDVPKHLGMSYFLCNMHDPGVDVRPLRQITGEAEFNEVFLTDVRIPDAHRLGAVGEGWKVANFTLNNERVAIGGGAAPREGAMIRKVAETWRAHPELRTPDFHDRLLRLWVDSEAMRITGMRLRQKLAAGQPGPEGSAMKLSFARINQELTGLELEILGEDGLRYSDWTMRRPEKIDMAGRDAGYRYLRAKGNSIEGGTSEILRNIVAERILGLPGEHRVDKDVPWKEIPR
jgi:alkylation response protein AidB-like acyl-CoA dehydrogenase